MTHFFHNIKYFATFLAILLTSMSSRGQLTIDEKVDSVLNLMSLSEKVGQMAQAERGELENINDIATFGLGSLLSGGGSAPTPNNLAAWVNMYDNFQSIALQSNRKIPIIYGIDAVHGHNNVYGAVIFPHNIGMGCTWNADLVRNAYAVVAREVAATGIDWTFAPCIAVPRNERWGRIYEGFGETPEIQKIMAAASVSGLQGNDLGVTETILSCAKHYVGDGGTAHGIDQGNTIAFESSLREIHMAGYIDAIEAGDWMQYQVKVTESGLYSLSCRISGYEPGTLQFAFNDSIQAFVGYTATNGWQNWQDFTTEVYLNAGNYIMEVVAQYHAFNINYYHFELEDGISDQEAAISGIKVFPNPASSDFHLEFSNTSGRMARIRLIDVTGKISRELYNGSIDPGKNLFNFPLDRELPSGLYFVEIKDESKRYFIKLLKD